jgi:hypothetical protein
MTRMESLYATKFGMRMERSIIPLLFLPSTHRIEVFLVQDAVDLQYNLVVGVNHGSRCLLILQHSVRPHRNRPL